jgi:hypothetical protein
VTTVVPVAFADGVELAAELQAVAPITNNAIAMASARR